MNVEFISGVRISSAHRLLSIAAIQNQPETKQYTRNPVPNVLKQQKPQKNTDFYLQGASCLVKIRARVAEFLAQQVGCVSLISSASVTGVNQIT